MSTAAIPPVGWDAQAAGGIVEAVLRSLPELRSMRVGQRSWAIVLEGEVRHAIPVAIDVDRDACTLRSFLLRGPRRGDGAAALHRVLLRKNAGLVWLRLCLDGDDDVVVTARIPRAALTEATLQEALGEVLTVGETGFEALVHTAYPGVFPPLPRIPRA